MSEHKLQLSITYKETTTIADLQDGILLLAGTGQTFSSIKDFCDHVTNKQTTGQVTDKIAILVDGSVYNTYEKYKPLMTPYKGGGILKALYDLVLGEVGRSGKENQVVASKPFVEVADANPRRSSIRIIDKILGDRIVN